jgi:shikimate kinase
VTGGAGVTGGHVYLVGMPGSGKSSAGRALAEVLGLPFVDLDEEVERSAGSSIAQIFGERGEDGFRELERAALAGVAAGPPSVVACGGGVPLREDNREVLRSTGVVVALRVPLSKLRARVASAVIRPLIRGPVDLRRIDRERAAIYRDVADHRVDGRGDPAEVARRIAEALR